MPFQRSALLICLAAALAACTTVPVTGRRSLSLVSDSELTAVSLDAYRKLLDGAELSTDPDQIELVQRVGSDIARATENYLSEFGYSTAGYDWEFNVIKDDETINAFAMPGGKVAVYTGILAIAEDESGLATIIGHEIAHVLARHGNERVSQNLIVGLGGAVISSTVGEGSGNAVLAAYGAASQVGILLPYSRKHESEADRIGLTLMARAGYHPGAAIGFWTRMNEQSGDRPPQFISTHPAPEARIQNIESYLPEALEQYRYIYDRVPMEQRPFEVHRIRLQPPDGE